MGQDKADAKVGQCQNIKPESMVANYWTTETLIFFKSEEGREREDMKGN